MDTVITFTPKLLIGGFLSVCAGISCIAAAVGWIVKVVNAAKRPSRRTDERLTAVEQILDEHEKYLAHDKARIEAIEHGQRVTQKALLALLSHGIDGNDVDAMIRAKAELQEYLINKP